MGSDTFGRVQSGIPTQRPGPETIMALTDSTDSIWDEEPTRCMLHCQLLRRNPQVKPKWQLYTAKDPRCNLQDG